MAVPNSRRFVLEGTLPGNERFAFSWAAVGPVIVGATAQDTADAVASNAAMTGFIAATKTFMNTGTAITTLRCYFYDNQGNLADAGSAAVSGGTGSGTSVHPNQAALAISLRTASATRSGRGRMFLPCTGAAMSTTTGKLNSAPSGLASATAGLMSYTVAQVASETQGIIRPVTAVRVGDVIDTIRQRRSRLVEVYASASV